MASYFVDSGAIDLFKVKASSPGLWGNDLKADIENIDTTDHDFDLVILQKDPNDPTNFIEVERFEAVSLDPSSSRYALVAVNDGIQGQPKSDYVVLELASPAPVIPVDPAEPANPIVLAAGSDGGIPIASDYVGTDDGAASTGVYALQDAETINVNMIAIPKISSDVTVAEAIRVVCEEKRKDCFGFIDPDSSAETLATLQAWKTGLGTTGRSSFLTTLWPYAKIHDDYNDRDVWVPGSVLWPRAIVHTDDISEPWFSPAGLNRGLLYGVKELAVENITQTDRDVLFDRAYAINCIKEEPGIGFVVYGDLTMYHKPSALQLLPVRRMLLFVEKTIAGAVKYLLFEPNDPVTWQTFIGLVTPVLQQVQDGRGLENFEVVCDETTTTPAHQQRREIKAVLKLIPVNTTHNINMDFSLYPAGASFSE
jgi:hypothetical protein